jgi:hypothetical protein
MLQAAKVFFLCGKAVYNQTPLVIIYNTCIHIDAHTHIYRVYIYIYIYIYTYIHTYIHIYIYMYIYRHTCIHMNAAYMYMLLEADPTYISRYIIIIIYVII